MRRNSTGGKSHRKKRKGQPTERVVPTKSDGQDYGIVQKAVGDGRFVLHAIQENPEPILARVCGRMRRKRWVRAGDCVLFSSRDTSDKIVDILHVYSPDDLRVLRSLRQIPLTEDNDMFSESTDAVEQDQDDTDLDIDLI